MILVNIKKTIFFFLNGLLLLKGFIFLLGDYLTPLFLFFSTDSTGQCFFILFK